VLTVVQVVPSNAPVTVAPTVVPAKVCPQAIGAAEQAASLAGGQLSANEKAEFTETPETRM
jgi:hypothetical protein